MNIYSSGGAYGSPSSKSTKGHGKRGKLKRLRRIRKVRLNNRDVRTGTSTAGKAVTFGMGNSGTGLIRSANNQSLTSNTGLGPYDGFGIIAAGGNPVMFMQLSCGTDFASAEAAFAGKKNIKCTLTIDGVDYVGILDTGSFSSRGYKVVFLQLTSLFSPSAGTSTGFRIEFTT